MPLTLHDEFDRYQMETSGFVSFVGGAFAVGRIAKESPGHFQQNVYADRTGVGERRTPIAKGLSRGSTKSGVRPYGTGKILGAHFT